MIWVKHTYNVLCRNIITNSVQQHTENVPSFCTEEQKHTERDQKHTERDQQHTDRDQQRTERYYQHTE